MSTIPLLSLFSNLDECPKLNGSIGDYPLDMEKEFSFDCQIPVFNDNYEDSVNLFQDNFLSNNLSYLQEELNSNSDSHFNFENSLPEETVENSLPSSIISNWSNCENFIEPETDIESFSKELFPLNTPELFEQFNIENSDKIFQDLATLENSDKIFQDIPESTDLIKEEKATTTEYPKTIILKKIKGTPNNLNMVAPLNIPKTTYKLVRIPGKNTTTNMPEKVSVFNLNQNIIPSKKNEICSNIKSQKYINVHELSPVSVNKKPAEEFTEKVSIKLPQKNNTIETLNYNELPFTSLKRKLPNLSKPKPQKKKAYELSPLPDPTLERCRRNAINAKKNRDIKKEKMMKLEAEVEQERQEKLKLASENETLKQMNEELKERINLLTTALECSSEPTLENIKKYKSVQEFFDELNASSILHQDKIF
ncbi:hypothetical protein Anas_02274 [Armadillidium nasatum]|uniref:BZIP domain-containing protein n=1 Tax=Armadillidium nasatum TaxID=96803 RepID=A0A5N5TDR1_9CRUS|nr:hypothetical protein Anas_02274 [Armadillidium nasatum]